MITIFLGILGLHNNPYCNEVDVVYYSVKTCIVKISKLSYSYINLYHNNSSFEYAFNDSLNDIESDVIIRLL